MPLYEHALQPAQRAARAGLGLEVRRYQREKTRRGGRLLRGLRETEGDAGMLAAALAEGELEAHAMAAAGKSRF